MGEAALQHPKAGFHDSARPEIRTRESDSPRNSGAISFLRQKPLHPESDLQMRALRNSCDLLECGAGKPDSQPSRPKLLDGDAHRPAARPKFPRGESRYGAWRLQTCSHRFLRHGCDSSSRRCARRTCAPGAQPPGIRRARDQHSHLFLSVCELRSIFDGARIVCRRSAALFERIWQVIARREIDVARETGKCNFYARNCTNWVAAKSSFGGSGAPGGPFFDDFYRWRTRGEDFRASEPGSGEGQVI